MEKYYRDEAVRFRRMLHEIPETGWEEVRTTIVLLRALESFGYEVTYGKKIHGTRYGVPSREVYEAIRERNQDFYEERFEDIFQGYTGVIARMDTGKPGNVVGFRFDIDALAIQESSGTEHLPAREGFASRYPGKMHACAHDGHMAVGLALAHWIADHRDALSGSLVFLFQPAEEGVRGAESFLTSGQFPKLDKLFGMHIGLGMEPGIIGVGTRGFLASEHLDLRFKGKPAHSGNAPEEGKNSLLAAASAALAIHSLTQYGNGIAMANVGTMQAGSSRNTVPGGAVLGVNLRANREEILTDLHARMEKAAQGAAMMYENELEMELFGRAAAYDEVNEKLAAKAVQLLEAAGIPCSRNHSFGASEDVTGLMRKVEADGGETLHLMIGTKLAGGHHSGDFDFDEEALGLALDVMEILIKAEKAK